MDNIQPCNWMEQMGASKDTIEELQRSDTDVSDLVFCMDTGRQSNENIEMVERQLKLAGNPKLCMHLRQRLTSEAANEREGRDQERRMEVQADGARLECKTMYVRHEMDMMRYEAAALAKSKGESDSDEDKPGKLRYDKIMVNTPRASDVKNIVDGVS